MSSTVADVRRVVEDLWPPALAASWDAIGLVCGDPDAPVERVLLAVDPVDVVVDEALAWSASLLLTHHPLYLRPTSSVAADTPKGRLVHRLVRGGTALQVAHTNADHADPGVSDALAAALGVTVHRPLDAQPGPLLDAHVVFVPAAATDRVYDAMVAAGAGAVGDYDGCSWRGTGEGTFRPGPGARPAVGSAGTLERVVEDRLEMVAPRSDRHAVLAAMRSAHPYEEVAHSVLELAPEAGRTGTGRVGELAAPMTLRAFTDVVGAALPATAWGVRAAGDPDRVVRTVAVCGGSGDSLLGAAAAAGVDVYVTADLRHHPASEHLAQAGDQGPALVDVAHWASEWPWLEAARVQLAEALATTGDTVDLRVSRTPTDPWTLHAPSRPVAADRSHDDERSSR